MKKGTVAAGEVRISYLQEGRGKPLLLLHSMGVSGRAWREVMKPLGQSFAVYAWDMPGHGDSEKPPRWYTIPDYARRAVDFLEALGIKKAAVVGNSIGASIAAEMAAAWPRKVERLVLVGCPGWETVEERLQRLALAGAFLTPEGNPKPYSLKDLGRNWAHPTPQILRWVNRERAKAGLWVMKGMMAVNAYEIPKRLGRISCPTLIVYGSQDMLRDKEGVLRRGIRSSNAVVIPGAGHLPQIEAPQAFLQATLPFLIQGR